MKYLSISVHHRPSAVNKPHLRANLVALPNPEQLEALIENDRAPWQQHHPESLTKD
jgi:hypothetical protein